LFTWCHAQRWQTQKSKGEKLAVGAKVLIDPSKEEPYTQSINRAEIKIDIQTDQY